MHDYHFPSNHYVQGTVLNICIALSHLTLPITLWGGWHHHFQFKELRQILSNLATIAHVLGGRAKSVLRFVKCQNPRVLSIVLWRPRVHEFLEDGQYKVGPSIIYAKATHGAQKSQVLQAETKAHTKTDSHHLGGLGIPVDSARLNRTTNADLMTLQRGAPHLKRLEKAWTLFLRHMGWSQKYSRGGLTSLGLNSKKKSGLSCVNLASSFQMSF